MGNRYRSEEEWQAAVERRARQLWDDREMEMPAFARQKWEQGTELARQVMLAKASNELRNAP